MKTLMILLVGAGIGVGLLSLVQRHGPSHLTGTAQQPVIQENAKEPTYSYSNEELQEIQNQGLSPKPASPDIRALGNGNFELTARFYQRDMLLRRTTYVAKCKAMSERICCQTDASQPAQIVDYTATPPISRTETSNHRSNGFWYSYRKWKDQLLMEKSSV